MKHLKNFKDNASFEAISDGIDYMLVAKVEEQVHVITPPTIYYTTTNGEQISNSATYLGTTNIISHTKESNGEYKIVLKRSITSIPSGCFIEQKTLASIRFAGFDNVTEIGKYFLDGCSELTVIDLLSFKNIKSIDESFLGGCSSLQTINLTPLTKAFDTMKSTSFNFLADCLNLQIVDLSPLKNVTSIEGGFLSNCSSLTSIDLSPLNNVESISNYFLQNCTGLTTLTMPDADITSIGVNYLSSCPKLTTIYVPSNRLSMYQNLMPNRYSIMVEMD